MAAFLWALVWGVATVVAVAMLRKRHRERESYPPDDLRETYWYDEDISGWWMALFIDASNMVAGLLIWIFPEPPPPCPTPESWQGVVGLAAVFLIAVLFNVHQGIRLFYDKMREREM